MAKYAIVYLKEDGKSSCDHIVAENAAAASRQVDGEVIGVYKQLDECSWYVIYKKYA